MDYKTGATQNVAPAHDDPLVTSTRAILRVLLGEAEYEEAQLINYVKGIGYR